MTLPDPHPIEDILRSGAVIQLDIAAADWLRDVSCLLWDTLPKCEQCGGKGHATNGRVTNGIDPCPSCHGTGKLDPVEHLRGLITLWAAVHDEDNIIGTDHGGRYLDADELRSIEVTP